MVAYKDPSQKFQIC